MEKANVKKISLIIVVALLVISAVIGLCACNTNVTTNSVTSGITSTIPEKSSPTYTIPTGLSGVIGDRLSSVELPVGFSWKIPTTKITSDTDTYYAIYTPEDIENYYAVIVSITLTLVDNNGNEVIATNSGVATDAITDNIDTKSTEYVNYTKELISVDEELEFTITLDNGTTNCYTIEKDSNGEYVVTFSDIEEDTAYIISGTLDGYVVIDVAEDYEFELILQGAAITSYYYSPILALGGDKITITAKKNTENYVLDERGYLLDSDETLTLYKSTIYSKVDLVIGGKGTLNIVSANNNGIHTKDDLKVKNLSLNINCKDNALKGNDSVTITGATATLIASTGDGIKTSNSDISSKGNQRGTITIGEDGDTTTIVNIYAATDGIDASYNVEILGENTVLNIYTDRYSPYSEEVTTTSTSTTYVRTTSTNYKFSFRFVFNDGTEKWLNSSSYSTVTSNNGIGGPGGKNGSTYYYYSMNQITGYSYIEIYAYTNSQSQESTTNYNSKTTISSWNTSYDTLSYNGNSFSWTNKTTAPTGGVFGPSGMQEGNSDKGDYSTKGIKAANSITIYNGIISIKSYDDAIHANNDETLENGETATGNITINNGTLAIYSNDDAIHADGTITINGGAITITNAYEGIEGARIVINDGSISIVASDDGFNSKSTNGYGITINGGYIFVYAGGDALDSNSNTKGQGILFAGGNVVAISKGQADSALDTNSGYTYNGGDVLAISMAGGMGSESANTTSSNKTIKSSLSISSGSYVTVTINGATKVVVKSPISISAQIVYLGSNTASITTSSNASATLDSNGVYWNV